MMTTRSTKFLALGLLCFCYVVGSAPDMTLKNKICNAQKFMPWDSFASARGDVLNDLSANTAKNGYNYYSKAESNGESCYGHGACNGALVNADCASCMSFAKDRIKEECGQSIGAQIQLQDCRIRYENYLFSE
ncbi:hypothetical protein BT93_L5253 [Corymbia citriodora subsp. variegata]|uniref:Gnk2-homologous domain-containing protein n=1 Tax=Corymbia citriodora subsp. variegata TaxID=360336 RepID=A0A8T0CSU0_CORYI|nr:hypothetical protein BT93_L5253 [Corymbia citriodora subsp. variegata]